MIPVTKYEKRSQRVYLPGDGDWINVWNGVRFFDGQWVECGAPPEQILVNNFVVRQRGWECTGERQKLFSVVPRGCKDLCPVEIFPHRDEAGSGTGSPWPIILVMYGSNRYQKNWKYQGALQKNCPRISEPAAANPAESGGRK